MFLHLGGDDIISAKDIVAIIDIETMKSKVIEEFLSTAHEEGIIKNVVANGKEKSLIITDKIIYLSPISSLTLKKRASYLSESETEEE